MEEKRDLNSLLCRPIGIIHTPFKELENMPIQPSGAAGIPGTVELIPEFADGLKDLDGFSKRILPRQGGRVILIPNS